MTETTFTDSKGTEIAQGATIRTKGSKIDRSITSLYMAGGRMVIVADRLDGEGAGRNWRVYTTGQDVTVVA
jgi:hypothetical protein